MTDEEKAAAAAAAPDIKALAEDLKKATSEVQTFAKKAEAEIKSLGKMTEETKAGADKALTEMNAKVGKIIEDMATAEQKANGRLVEMEQRMARRGGGQVEEMKSLGQIVIESEQVKAMAGAPRGARAHVTIERKNITSAPATVGTGVSPTTSLVVPQREPIVGIPLRRIVVRDLITPGQTTSSNIEYPVESGPFDPKAAVVSEGVTKPYSGLKFDLKSAPVRTIAALMKASRQILDDAPQLSSYIDGRLRYELEYVEEGELLLGDGTGQHLHGLVPQATAYSGAFSISGETAIDRLRLASLQATLALYPATGYVLHPTDWAVIETLKDGLGRYIIGNPQGSITKMLWGLPVVDTQAMTVHHFLTGAFRLGAQIFDRMSIEVLISTENDKDFEMNLISIRGEERLALAVYRPAAFVTGTLP
jgi:HK97 family phage major capsid protein